MKSLRLGVVGTGHLGRIHARLIPRVDGADLVAIADPSPTSLAAADVPPAVTRHADHRDMLGRVDAVVVASPTGTHAAVVGDCLTAGKHVLCEKPLTIDASDARRLAMRAGAAGLILQVGHVERFNPALTALDDLGRDVRYVDAVRASSFPGRCLDVGVVMDLMIHDLDLILSLAQSPVVDVRATGAVVVSDHEDVAEARIEFASGMVASVRASRIDTGACRKMRIAGERGSAEIDFQTPSIRVVRHSDVVRRGEFDLSIATDNPLTYRDELFATHLRCEELSLTPRNAILDELHDFVLSVTTGCSPVVDGHAAAAAVDLAQRITHQISRPSRQRIAA